MDGIFGLRLEIYKALRQDRLAQAARERCANEARPPLTPLLLLTSLVRRRAAMANVAPIRWVRQALTAAERLPGPAPRVT